MSMMLSELLPEFSISTDVEVLGVSDDSRKVSPGELFCAYRGESSDGKQFVSDAVGKGAVAVLADGEVEEVPVPVVECPELRDEVGDFAARFFNHPSAQLEVIAVTGTNGKTSFTQLLAQAIESHGTHCGVIGTMGYGRPGDLAEPGLTTPAAIDLQRRLSELQRTGCAAVVLEASSHGLVQGRLNGTQVHTAVMTNVTHDHLDYHGTFERYVQAKCELFKFTGLRNAVINADDPSSIQFKDALSSYVHSVTFSRSDKRADVWAENIGYLESGISLFCHTPNGSVEAEVPVFGSFNAENLLAVIATLVALDWQGSEIEAALQKLQPVAGRMELVIRARKPTLIIDYAHTPDALAKCLDAVRDHFAGRRLICVFGCGGDRDTAKRPMMGGIAARRADQVVITSDNPRSEDPESIVADILRGVPPSSNPVSIIDRREAIIQAIAMADADDVIVIAGKGHEDYQELAAGRINFSDREIAVAVLDEKDEFSSSEEV